MTTEAPATAAGPSGSVPRLQESISAYWSGRAPEYDDYQLRPERWALDQEAWGAAFAAALPAAPARVLDVGTGSGYVALLLARLGHDVTATDLAEGMLARAHAHAAKVPTPPRFLRGDAVEPDFADGSFDAVTSRFLMWTLREPARALESWRRLLRPGGVLVAVDSTWFPEGMSADTSEDFVRWYDDEVRAALPLAEARSIDETRAMIEAAGFRDVAVTPLTRLLELDRAYGVAPGHEVRLQYLVRGVR